MRAEVFQVIKNCPGGISLFTGEDGASLASFLLGFPSKMGLVTLGIIESQKGLG